MGYNSTGWYGVQGQRSRFWKPMNLGALSEQDVMNVFELVTKELNIDENRMYLWGHSMGGAGTYHLAEQHPNLWAAVGVAAPAPSVDPSQLEAFKHVPIIVLQGDEDGLVTTTREWVAKMKEIGMEHLYVEVQGGDHSRFINANADTLEKIFAFFNIVRKDQRPQTN